MKFSQKFLLVFSVDKLSRNHIWGNVGLRKLVWYKNHQNSKTKMKNTRHTGPFQWWENKIKKIEEFKLKFVA